MTWVAGRLLNRTDTDSFVWIRTHFAILLGQSMSNITSYLRSWHCWNSEQRTSLETSSLPSLKSNHSFSSFAKTNRAHYMTNPKQLPQVQTHTCLASKKLIPESVGKFHIISFSFPTPLNLWARFTASWVSATTMPKAWPVAVTWNKARATDETKRWTDGTNILTCLEKPKNRGGGWKMCASKKSNYHPWN